MTRLYLVRHAQAAEPGDLRLPGPDLSLTELGRRQSGALGRRLCRPRPVALYSSDSARARETAEAIVRGFVGREVALTIDPFLREIDFGQWGGRTYDEVVAEQASAAAYFADPGSGKPPGGEHLVDVAARVVDTFGKISLAYPGDAVVVVGHGGSLRLALAAMLGVPLNAYWRFRLDCAGLSLLHWSHGAIIVERLNDVSHLDGPEDCA